MATEADKVNDGALATLIAVGVFSMIGISAFVTALVRYEMSSEAERKDVGAARQAREIAAAQRAKLSAPPAWVDRGKGLVSVPIDRAKELVVGDLTRDPNSATPPPPRPEDAGAAPAANVPEAGTEAADAGVAPEAGAAVQGSPAPDQLKSEPGGAKKTAAATVQGKPAPAPAPAPVTPPAPAPVAPASVASPTPQK